MGQRCSAGCSSGEYGGRWASRIPSGTTRFGAVCQPALSSPSTRMRSRPAPASRANKASSAAKNGLETPFETYQNTSPEHLAGDRLHEGGDVQPLVAGVTKCDGPLTLGGPHPPDDRLQPNAVLVGRPDFDRLVRVLGPLLGDSLFQLFLNVSHSSGVAAAGWRGRGFCPDQLIAFRASQPRWGKTAASPSSPAIQRATLGPVHRPPSDGGVASRSGNRARSSGRSTLGALPFRRRKSPRASGPCAL